MSYQIGAGLRAQRRRKFLSQQELADQSGVSKATIARIETRGTAQAETVRKLAQALGVEPAELMREPEPGQNRAA